MPLYTNLRSTYPFYSIIPPTVKGLWSEVIQCLKMSAGGCIILTLIKTAIYTVHEITNTRLIYNGVKYSTYKMPSPL